VAAESTAVLVLTSAWGALWDPARDWVVAGPVWRGWAMVGIGLVLAAALWRWGHRRAAARRLVAALRDPVTARRRAAIEVAAEQGLRPFARHLLELAEQEYDPAVVDALVDAVLRNTWEPAGDRTVQELRLWAHAEHAARAPRPRAVWTEPAPRGPEPTPPPSSSPRHAAPAPRPPAALPRPRTEQVTDERRAGNRHRAGVVPAVRVPTREGEG
jgi:hypothetical protein